jgi:hypothetical protein
MQMSNNGDIDRLVTLADYQESRQHIFQSRSSLDWYVRQHKDALVAGCALLMIAGQWKAHADRFDRVVMEEGAKTAQRRQREAV